MVNVEFVAGGGGAVGDINNDGWQDIFFTGNQLADRLYLNKGNLQFEDISGKAGISDEEIWSTGVTFVDIDADGDVDVLLVRCDRHLGRGDLEIDIAAVQVIGAQFFQVSRKLLPGVLIVARQNDHVAVG